MLLVGIGVLLIIGIFDERIFSLLRVFGILLVIAILGVNFTLYTMSNFQISKDAMINASDGDGKINPILQKTYLEFIGRVFGWIVFLEMIVMWFIYSDILKDIM